MENDKKPTTGDNVTYYEGPDKDLTDDQLLKRIKDRDDSCKAEIDEYVEADKENTKYYFAKYVDKKSLRKGEEDNLVPKLFENLETVIPIVTRKSPEPIVTPFPKTKKNLRFAKALENDLREAWDTSEEDDGLEVQPKLEENTRNLFTQKIEIFKYYWDKPQCKMCLEPVTLDKLRFPTKSKSVYDAPFIIEICTGTLGYLCKKFPEKELLLRAQFPGKSDDTEVEYYEYWENDFVAWRYKDILLGRGRNPYWNWPREIDKLDEVTGQTTKVMVKGVNHFKRPQKPYIMGADIKKGTGLFAATSLVEINKGEVRTIDKRKRQIDKNANLANGQVVIAGKAIEKADAQKLTFSGTGIIYLPEAETVTGAIDILTGRAVDQAVVNDYLDSKRNIDGTTGAYGTVRGEREAEETAAGRTILKESSYGRSEPLFRLNERLAQKIFNARAQMICVFEHEPRTVTFDVPDSTVRHTVSSDMFKTCTFKIKVKEGSTVPVDKKTLQAQAFDLAKMNRISNIDLMKDLEYEDAEGRAQRAWQEMNDPAALYGLTGEETQYNTEAITHIKAIINRQVDATNPMFAYDMDDLALYQAHYKTHADYVKGVELREDLDAFKDLDIDTQLLIRQHMKIEGKILQAMVRQEMQKQIALRAAAQQQADLSMTQTNGTQQGEGYGGTDTPNPALVQQMAEKSRGVLPDNGVAATAENPVVTPSM